MRVVFAGTPEPAALALRALLASRHEVAAAITRPAARAGRGRKVVTSPVGEIAAEHGLEVLSPQSTRDPELADRLVTLAPDACPVVAYGALIPPALLQVPRLGWVNLHFSLLPSWRGAAPVQRALLAGDELTGATTFVLEEGLDTGPVLGSLTEPIRATDTSGDLLERLATAGAELLVATLDGLEEGSLTAQPQPADGVSHAPKLTVEDARIDWSRPAYAVDRLVRGCTPAPGAWTTFRGDRLKVQPLARAEQATVHPGGPAESHDVDQPGPRLRPGEIEVGRRSVLVGTGSDPVRLGTVQPQGKKAMPATDWARGARIEAEELLGG
ncbi:methionyl-tRNA formyltransferase [Ornithinimicrobium cryptoxanthini]|uniref:methionyl-tRNA formyltransferase n=1 Tax=Ornithinimicrobium cryptoxanthini TaxID=2934161 RepID=UPI002118EF8F|nr:methionyl-tRNA formyltransferase [Ornithinimicrobium cryptoxanthini]